MTMTAVCPRTLMLTRFTSFFLLVTAESRHLRVTSGGTVLLEGALANPVMVDEDTGKASTRAFCMLGRPKPVWSLVTHTKRLQGWSGS